jgi:hypothetical protein
MDVSGRLHSSVALLPGERAPGTHFIGGWVGPRADLDAAEKRKTSRCLETNPDQRLYNFWNIIATPSCGTEEHYTGKMTAVRIRSRYFINTGQIPFLCQVNDKVGAG